MKILILAKFLRKDGLKEEMKYISCLEDHQMTNDQ